jgi:hypothetical protein
MPTIMIVLAIVIVLVSIWDMEISVPASNAFFDLSRVVRYGIDTDVL